MSMLLEVVSVGFTVITSILGATWKLSQQINSLDKRIDKVENMVSTLMDPPVIRKRKR